MRVCVVGAGAAGLPAIKACVEEGLEVVCYEKTADIGGLWNYRPNDPEVGGTVMATTVVNTSKEMMAYSDFPPDEKLPNFMHHSLLLQYIRDYAVKFDLLRHVHFNTPVKMITKEDGRWRVQLEKGDIEYFDRLMLCTGHHARPQHPQLRGMDMFRGRVMHAHEYRDFKGFEGKDVFLLGIGNSALDIAVDLAKIAKSVTISTRRGSWIFNRVSQGGMPYDTLLMTRVYDWLMKTIPWTVANDFMEHRLQQRMDHDIYGLRPLHRFFQQHPTVNDALANLLCAGLVTITEDIDCLTPSSVIVKGGRSFPCDVFISCTGYAFGYPYLEPGTLAITDHRADLYKYVFPMEAEDVAVIGLIQPIGSIAPIAEMQARWSARVFAGRISLPSSSERREDAERKRQEMRRRYFESTKHTIQVDYLKYMDEISELIGCHPSPSQYLLSDPQFALQLIAGPNVPYAYRLHGPHAWDGARKAIEEVGSRVKRPLKNRECRMRKHKRRGRMTEWFRYASLKWIAGWTTVLLTVFLFALCSTPLTPLTYLSLVTVFLLAFVFLLLWFDLQYDMTTVL
ncbi:hypothetical protein PENTCL1PPCAC_479 [Pristionchus entomophagus]|uniref:Flavin-containing monooxygenase n=1 Tax=Pristionchus entomophagus TaxID=358040 RepID=A0AAV5S7H9_9BILA|nr:hypothetical protein PENTCL1PPCAC_479 [Pristionchus entomophagus]